VDKKDAQSGFGPDKQKARNPGLCRLLKKIKIKIRRPFKNGEMQGREKIQGAQCIGQMRGLDFFTDAADCRFWAAC
jgi:hypothetical protein